ncbi:hypothetical protein TNCV_4125291 [Trichonephila clavipes]|nr:hypothetical protein TNCV_4125291 [Trichonephila clavipes]
MFFRLYTLMNNWSDWEFQPVWEVCHKLEVPVCTYKLNLTRSLLTFNRQRLYVLILDSVLLLLLMPPDRQRPAQGPRNPSWQRAK